MSHALDYQMFGTNPARHHDVNVLFHALDVVLLFWVLKEATGYTGRSFMVAALFAVHPMNVEAVAWIACAEAGLILRNEANKSFVMNNNS
jgi:hypothetical protein